MNKANMKRIPVSIGIPVHNEKRNVGNLLNSIFGQEENGFFIKEIILISDGSTDRSEHEIKKISDKRIKCLTGKNRLGKATRLNQIFRMAKGEVIVLFDADVIIDSTKTISYLIKPFIKNDRKLGLVGGNPHPRKAEAFIEKAVNTTYYAYLPLRKNLRNGENPFGCDGKVLALSKQLAQFIRIPKDMIGVDSFLYFSCITKGFKFLHETKATVVYRSVTNFKEHLKQNVRFEAAQYIQKDIFGASVEKEFKVPFVLLLKLLFTQFLKTPVHSIFIFIVNLYTKYQAKQNTKDTGALWSIALSTKRGIKYG